MKPPRNRGKPPPPLVLKTTDIAAKPKLLNRGTPPKYNETVANRICELMSEGLSMQAILRDYQHDGVPTNMNTIYNWLGEHEEFRLKYTQARKDQQHFYVAQMVDIADDLGIPPEHKKHMLNARQWLATKVLPEQYGDRVRAELTGAGGGPVQVQATVVDAASLDVEQREALKAALVAVRGKQESDDE